MGEKEITTTDYFKAPNQLLQLFYEGSQRNIYTFFQKIQQDNLLQSPLIVFTLKPI